MAMKNALKMILQHYVMAAGMTGPGITHRDLWTLLTRVSILRHSCGLSNLVQLLSNPNHVKQKCPFYWKMRGGDTYYGNLYFFYSAWF